MRILFIYLHILLGQLVVEMLGVNLTPLVYDGAFLLAHEKDVPH